MKNYGTYGGAIYGIKYNDFSLENCKFIENQGEYASVIFLEEINNFTLKNAIMLQNQGFVLGGLILFQGEKQILIIINIIFKTNQSPFKGALIEMNTNNEIRAFDIFIEYSEDGYGDFLRLQEFNTILALNFTIVNILNLERFIYCNNNNVIIFDNCLIENNIWLNSFFYSQIKNNFYIRRLSVYNITVQESAGGFMMTDSNTKIILNQATFQRISAKSSFLLSAEINNTMIIQDLVIDIVSLLEKGLCIYISIGNNIIINRSRFSNFSGFSNPVFLLKVIKHNRFSFEELTIIGTFKIEQDINISSLFSVLEGQNNILIYKLYSFSNNPELYKNKTLIFFDSNGNNNDIEIQESRLTLHYYSSFINLRNQSIFLMKQGVFTDCILSKDLFLIEGSILKLNGLKLDKNILSDKKSFFRISNKVLADFMNVICNTNNIFLISSDSTFKVFKSSFTYLFAKDMSMSAYLLYLENNTDAKILRTDILLRQNFEDSIIISKKSVLFAEDSLFGFNKAKFGGVLKLSDHTRATFINNKFLGNQGVLGGVIKFENITLFILEGNLFYLNRAVRLNASSDSLGKGGCIYASLIINTPQMLFVVNIDHNTFTNNHAEIGGIIYLEDSESCRIFISKKFSIGNLFKNSKASFYGPLMASPIKDQKLSKGEDLNDALSDSLVFDSIPFTETLQKCLFQIVGIDFFGQVTVGAKNIFKNSIDFKDGFSLKFSNINSFPCINSLVPLSYYSLSNIIKQDIVISLKTSEVIYYQESLENTTKTYYINIKLKKCQTGEFFDFKVLQCLACEPNFFSLDNDFFEPSSCKSCVEEPFYCYGGFNITPRAGYWRSHSSSINFIKCPNPEACKGDPQVPLENYQLSILYLRYDVTFPNGICALGYQGALCHECQPGYAKTGGINCVPCSGGLSIFLMVIKIVIRVFLYYYTIFKAVMMCINVRDNNISKDLVFSNFFLKIIILHFQFLKSFLAFPFTFPSLLADIFNILSFSITSGADKVLNLECFFNFRDTPKMYVYTILTIVAPMLVVSSISLLLHYKEIFPKFFRINIFKDVNNSSFKLASLPFLLLISLMLSYDEIMSLLLKNFSSININDSDNPDYRIVNQYQLIYYSTKHQTWTFAIVLPCIIFIGFLNPLYIMISIWKAKKKNKLKSESFLFKFGYFFFAYDKKQILYEAVYLIRKLFLLVMDTFFIRILPLTNIYDPSTFSVIICFFFTGFSILTFVRKPYESDLYPALNKMENLSVTIQALLAWIGCFLLSFKNMDGGNSRVIASLIGFCVGLFLNMTLIIIWVYYYWKLSFRQKIKAALKKINLKYVIQRGSKSPNSDLRLKYQHRNARKFSTFKDLLMDIDESEDENSFQDNENVSENKGEIFFPVQKSNANDIQGVRPRLINKLNRNPKLCRKFLVIRDGIQEEELCKLNKIEFFWNYFEKYTGVDRGCTENVRLGANYATSNIFSIVKFSKRTKLNTNANADLEIVVVIKTSQVFVAEIESLSINMTKNEKFSISLSDFQHFKKEETLSLTLIVHCLSLCRLHFTNKLLFGLVAEGKEELVSLELDVYIIDFFFEAQDKFFDSVLVLEELGKKKSSGDKVLQIQTGLLRKKVFQFIKTQKFLTNDEQNFEYYYREVSKSKKNEKNLVIFSKIFR